MFDAATQVRLGNLFRRENRSFLQYVHQSSPWSSAADQTLVDKINNLAEEELTALGQLAVWLDAERVPLPYLGAFSTTFTHYNFVGIRKLLGPLISEQRKELADLEADLNSLPIGAARATIETLVEVNRKHLRDFEQMTQPLAA